MTGTGRVPEQRRVLLVRGVRDYTDIQQLDEAIRLNTSRGWQVVSAGRRGRLSCVYEQTLDGTAAAPLLH